MVPPPSMERAPFDAVMQEAMTSGGGRGLWLTPEAATRFEGVREMSVGDAAHSDGTWNGCDAGPGYEAGMAGNAGGGWIPRDEGMFVSGGYHRGDALAHLTVSETGQLVTKGPGVLGARFDAFLETLPRSSVVEIVRVYQGGVDIMPQLSTEFKESLAGVSGSRRPKERNSAMLAGREGVARAGVAVQVAAASMRVLGRVEDVAASGQMPPVISKLTIEPKKGRMCIAPMAINEATVDKRPEPLEGTEAQRRMLGMFKYYLTTRDAKSGYANVWFTTESGRLFCVILHGWVIIKRGLEFGWCGSCATYQRLGMVCTGFFRWLGGRASLYVDDSLVASLWADGRTKAEGRVYAWDRLAYGHFGQWVSISKKPADLAPAVRSLGMIVNTDIHAFEVPEERQKRFLEEVAELQAQLGAARGAVLSRATGAHVAGVAMSFSAAIPGVRESLNVLYAVITGRKMGDYAGEQRAWWKFSSGGVEPRPVRGEFVGPLSSELARLAELVASKRTWPFVGTRHTVRVRLQNDATLVQYGAVIWRLREDGSWERTDEFGATLPEEFETAWGSISLALKNTGCTEMAGYLCTLRCAIATPSLRSAFENVHGDVQLDNLEDVIILNTGRVSGTQTIEKVELLRLVRLAHAELNFHPHHFHIASGLNQGDAPSRDDKFAHIRIAPAVFAQLLQQGMHRPTVDFFGSDAAGVTIEGVRIPYVAIGPDPGSCGTNFFSMDPSRQPGKITSCYAWINPPHVLAGAVVEHLREFGGVGAMLIPDVAAPWPIWRSELATATVTRLSLPAEYAQRRVPEGWRAVKNAPKAEVVLYKFCARAALEEGSVADH